MLEPVCVATMTAAVALYRQSTRSFLAIALLLASTLASAEDNSLLLVANPDLDSPVFGHSVVLVTPFGRGAAVGVIINHPLKVESGRVFPDDELLRGAGDIEYGGPVGPSRLTFLFQALEDPGNALHLFDNVYASNDRDLLAEQLRRPREESKLRVYLGYAGWAPGQLQAEISHGDWHVVKVSAKLLFHTDRELIWQQLIHAEFDDWI